MGMRESFISLWKRKMWVKIKIFLVGRTCPPPCHIVSDLGGQIASFLSSSPHLPISTELTFAQLIRSSILCKPVVDIWVGWPPSTHSSLRPPYPARLSGNLSVSSPPPPPPPIGICPINSSYAAAPISRHKGRPFARRRGFKRQTVLLLTPLWHF